MAATDIHSSTKTGDRSAETQRKYGTCGNALFSYNHSVSFPPFSAFRLHTHESCEIFCVFRGNGYYITEGARHKFEPGKIFLMRPGESHMPVLVGDEPYERLSFHFSPSIVDGIDPERRSLASFFDRPLGMNNVYDRSAVASTGIYEWIQKMDVQKTDPYDACLHVTALLYPVLNELKKLFDTGLFHMPNESSALMRAVVEFVNQNLTSDLSIEQICDKFYLSRGQLNRNFKNSTGATVWDYIVTKRLMLARSYIADGMRAGDAAAASGFGDYSAFYRAYCKKYGVTPTGQEKETIK